MSDEGRTVSERLRDPRHEAVTVAGAAEIDAAAGAPPIVAGYDLVRVLGRGGMGIVWEAVEHRFDRRVALKVTALEGAEAESDLWSEALVAAKIGDPSIVRVLDVGKAIDGRAYYAMELVDGTDLGALLADGPLPPRKALAIASDIARAAAAAHEHGVIHRDLKPRNVIVDSSGRARVLDFGLAFNLDAGKDRYEGFLAGSPSYMSPEQALGDPITPQTDIFPIGTMLYEMLAGARPFRGKDTDAILDAIVRHDPPAPSAGDPRIHADLDAVVARCLAKKPADRYPSARALFEILAAIVEGAPTPSPISLPRSYAPKPSSAPPPSRPRPDSAKKRLVWTWKLAAAPQDLWPYVANTDRFNKAVGLAPVVFTDEARAGGVVERTGELKVLGMQIRWREYPFEWIRGREHSVFRQYRAGPLDALWNRVTLARRDDGGTDLTHEIAFSPRGVVGQVAAFVELERKLGSSIDRFYRHLDDVLAEKRGGTSTDPFEPRHEPSAAQRALVEAACGRLHAEGFSAKLVEKLAMHLLAAPDGVVATLRPYELADAWGGDRAETLDLFIHAAHAGIVEAAWDVVCPRCMIAHETLDTLARVARTGTCKACAQSFERDLRDSVELVFVPHPSVRRVERATYCAGAPALRPHVVAQLVLDPGEERSVVVDLPRGSYRVAGNAGTREWDLVSSAVGFEADCAVAADGACITGRPDIVKAGAVRFTFVNDTDHEETVRVEVPGARSDAVCAAAAITHPSFRDCFSAELLAHGEHFRVSLLAFVFVAPLGREALYDRLGDAAVCAEVARLEDTVRNVARAREGTLVPSSLDLLVIALPTPLGALRAALDLRAAIDAGGFACAVALAAHEGRCLALTRDGRAEFFGETLHRGQALLKDCPRGGVALSASLAADRAVAVAMYESSMRVSVVKSEIAPYAGRRVAVLEPPA